MKVSKDMDVLALTIPPAFILSSCSLFSIHTDILLESAHSVSSTWNIVPQHSSLVACSFFPQISLKCLLHGEPLPVIDPLPLFHATSLYQLPIYLLLSVCPPLQSVSPGTTTFCSLLFIQCRHSTCNIGGSRSIVLNNKQKNEKGKEVGISESQKDAKAKIFFILLLFPYTVV